MAFRDVSVVRVRETLRRWLNGDGEGRSLGGSGSTARRRGSTSITAAVEFGGVRDAGEEQLTDELIRQVMERVLPYRLDGQGEAWRACWPRRTASRRG